MRNWVRFDTTQTATPYSDNAAITGHSRLADLPDSPELTAYVIENGDDRQSGWGHRSGTTFVVDTIDETLVSGTYSDTPSVEITKTGTSQVYVDLTSRSALLAPPGLSSLSLKYQFNWNLNQLDQSGVALTADRWTFIPCYFMAGTTDAVAVNVASANTASLKVGLHGCNTSGEPTASLVLGNTGASLVTGVNVITFASSYQMRSGWFFVSLLSDGAPSLRTCANVHTPMTPLGVGTDRPLGYAYKDSQTYSGGIPSTTPSGLSTLMSAPFDVCLRMT